MFWIQEHILIFLPAPTDGFEGEILARSGDQLLVAALSSLFCTIFCTPPQHSQFTLELLNFDIDTIGELMLLIWLCICRKYLQTLVFKPLANSIKEANQVFKQVVLWLSIEALGLSSTSPCCCCWHVAWILDHISASLIQSPLTWLRLRLIVKWIHFTIPHNTTSYFIYII